jgi:hypothetical protein
MVFSTIFGLLTQYRYVIFEMKRDGQPGQQHEDARGVSCHGVVSTPLKFFYRGRFHDSKTETSILQLLRTESYTTQLRDFYFHFIFRGPKRTLLQGVENTFQCGKHYAYDCLYVPTVDSRHENSWCPYHGSNPAPLKRQR